MSDRLTHWSSTFLILSGILIAVPILFNPDAAQPGFALQQAWVPVHILFGISALFGIAGLSVFYRVLGSRMSKIGHVAFVLVLLGDILLSGLMFFVEAAIVPVLAAHSKYEALMSITGPLMSGTFGAMVTISFAIMGVGFLLLAAYLVATRTISVLNGILFIGAPIAGFAPPFPTMLGLIGGVILGIALIWLGLSIRNGIAHEALAAGFGAYDECFLQAGGHA
jgi:hypothetical protein